MVRLSEWTREVYWVVRSAFFSGQAKADESDRKMVKNLAVWMVTQSAVMMEFLLDPWTVGYWA